MTLSTTFQHMVGGGLEALERPLAELKTSLRVSVEGVDQIISAIFMHHDGSHMARICVASRYLWCVIEVSASRVVLQA